MAAAVKMRKIGKGTSKSYYFRIGVIDNAKSRDGRVLEDLGVYEPAKKENNFRINKERFDYWKSKGAVISPTVRSLVKKNLN